MQSKLITVTFGLLAATMGAIASPIEGSVAVERRGIFDDIGDWVGDVFDNADPGCSLSCPIWNICRLRNTDDLIAACGDGKNSLSPPSLLPWLACLHT